MNCPHCNAPRDEGFIERNGGDAWYCGSFRGKGKEGWRSDHCHDRESLRQAYALIDAYRHTVGDQSGIDEEASSWLEENSEFKP